MLQFTKIFVIYLKLHNILKRYYRKRKTSRIFKNIKINSIYQLHLILEETYAYKSGTSKAIDVKNTYTILPK